MDYLELLLLREAPRGVVMTNIYAVKFEIEGTKAEVILNALNQGDAIRKAEEWFARKRSHSVPKFSARPLSSVIICGEEQEIIYQPSATVLGAFAFAAQWRT
jgi:hypothetical protein